MGWCVELIVLIAGLLWLFSTICDVSGIRYNLKSIDNSLKDIANIIEKGKQ